MGRRRPNVEEELLAGEAEATAEALVPPDQAKSQSPRRLGAPAAEAVPLEGFCGDEEPPGRWTWINVFMYLKSSPEIQLTCSENLDVDFRSYPKMDY